MSLDETVKEKDLVDLLWVFGCESSTVSSMIAGLPLYCSCSCLLTGLQSIICS